MYDDVKLELKQTQQVNRLERVKARAEIRTKRRIAEQLEKQKLKELEEKVALRNIEATSQEKDVFTESTTKNGRVQYRKNGKLISKEEYESKS